MTFVSFAQNFEDVMLWRALKDVTHGTYIDVGAQDPIIDSVSCAFYDAGWRGVHVEPNPEFAEKLRVHRPDETIIQALAADTVGLRTFYEIAGSGLSTARADIANFHREHHGHLATEDVIPSTTLDEIFTIAGETIHWLKVDVEGFEADVLRGWKTSPTRPWIVIVEATYPTTSSPIYEEWEHLVIEKGYALVYHDGLNRFYLHEDRSDLADRFGSPPNVLDDFQLSGTSTSITAQLAWRHNQLLHALTTERDGLSDALERSRLEANSLQQQLLQVTHERQAVVEVAIDSARRTLLDEHVQALKQQGEAHEKTLISERSAHHADLQAAIAREDRLRASFGHAADELRISAIELLRTNPPPAGFSSIFSRRCKRRRASLIEQMQLLLDRHAATDSHPQNSRLDLNPSYDHPSDMAGRQNVKTIVHIGGLIILEREEFIRTLYYNFLGRAPDESGMQFYLYCLYRGVSKEKIVYDIFNSPECKKKVHDFAGLDKMLQRERKRRKFPGAFLSRVANLFRSNLRSEVVIIEGRTPSWQPPVQERGIPEVPDSVLNDMSAAIEGLDQAHKDLFDKIKHISAAIEEVEARHAPNLEGLA